MAEDRSWMYNRIEKGLVRSEFRDGVLRFVDFALHQPGCTDGAKIKCPCILPKCRNKRYLEVDEVMIHLCRKGFIPHYEVWSSHGERFVHKDTHVGESSNRVDYRGDYIQMVMDAAGPEMFDVEMDEEPNPDAKKFYELLDAASKPLYPGSEKHTQLSFISRILNVKCESKMSNSAFSDVLQLIKEVIPEPNPGVPGNYYQAKKLMRGMGLPLEDRMDARIKQLTDEGVAYDINEVFGEVNAKTKKQRVVGLGSAASSFCIAPSGPSGESSGQSTRQVTEEIQQLKENLNIKDEEIRRLKEEQESMKEQFNEKLAEVFRRLDGTNEC
ncbi:hypothetical protein POM88_046284 [Heracleum sosnowskyi]|uniref:Transposase-associated domain-containing protein n=1 Tax=Heracleum sosnowskyi TaxID=360622 RepID=A0AAD8H912_9APIA|nr:hypothetical protein POM88_046284 [Heracleum sosnowskyi]